MFWLGLTHSVHLANPLPLPVQLTGKVFRSQEDNALGIKWFVTSHAYSRFRSSKRLLSRSQLVADARNRNAHSSTQRGSRKLIVRIHFHLFGLYFQIEFRIKVTFWVRKQRVYKIFVISSPSYLLHMATECMNVSATTFACKCITGFLQIQATSSGNSRLFVTVSSINDYNLIHILCNRLLFLLRDWFRLLALFERFLIFFQLLLSLYVLWNREDVEGKEDVVRHL